MTHIRWSCCNVAFDWHFIDWNISWRIGKYKCTHLILNFESTKECWYLLLKFVQGSFLDESAGLKKKEENLIIATATPKAKLTSTASWNKKVTKLVYEFYGMTVLADVWDKLCCDFIFKINFQAFFISIKLTYSIYLQQQQTTIWIFIWTNKMWVRFKSNPGLLYVIFQYVISEFRVP